MNHTQRDADICAYFRAGHGLIACEQKFKLKRQRLQQILRNADVWKPHVKSTRTKFLGVTVSEGTKIALKQKAAQDGVSVSKLTANALDALVQK